MNVLASPHGAQVVGIWVLVIVFALAAIGLWLTPVFIAYRRHSPNVGQVVVVTVALSWTGIGWVVALVMALKPLPPVGYGPPPQYINYRPQ